MKERTRSERSVGVTCVKCERGEIDEETSVSE